MKQAFLQKNRQGKDAPFCKPFLFLYQNCRLLSPEKFFRFELFMVLAFILITGCASDPKRPSSVATEVGQIRVALTQLIEAYENKSEGNFLAKLDSSSELHQSLKNRVSEDFVRFLEADLSIIIEQIEIEEKMLLTAVRWKGIWTTASASSPLDKRGNALFLWSPRKNPKLVEIRGSSPFSPFPK